MEHIIREFILAVFVLLVLGGLLHIFFLSKENEEEPQQPQRAPFSWWDDAGKASKGEGGEPRKYQVEISGILSVTMQEKKAGDETKP